MLRQCKRAADLLTLLALSGLCQSRPNGVLDIDLAAPEEGVELFCCSQ